MWLIVDICGTGMYQKRPISESCLAQSHCNNSCHNKRQNTSVLSVARRNILDSSVGPGQSRVKAVVEEDDAVTLLGQHVRFHAIINSHSTLTVFDTSCY